MVEYCAYDLSRNIAHRFQGGPLEKMFNSIAEAEKEHMQLVAQALASLSRDKKRVLAGRHWRWYGFFNGSKGLVHVNVFPVRLWPGGAVDEQRESNDHS